MKPNQINIDGVLYDLTPAGNPVFDAGKINDQLERIMAHPSAAAEPKGKEWEIVAFKLDDQIIKELQDNPGRFAWKNGYSSIRIHSLKEMISLKYPIHSVRRLSDNEVFAVGDWFSNNTGNIYSEHKIERFDVKEGEIFVYYELGNGRFYKSLKRLKKIAPTRTPLFTTTDGKPVYEGETFWYVAPDMYLGSFLSDGSKLIEGHKTFSTKAAAEQWIAENKPLYSLNDILAALPDEASKEGIAAILRAKKK